MIAVGALFGLVAVVFGAYAEHGLKATITDEEFRFIMTALRYNQIHAVVLLVIGFGLRLMPHTLLALSGWMFALGVFLFSFSIYASVAFQIPTLTYVTPFGGVVLMGAWAVIGYFGLKKL